jgi:uncharacterized protein (DUF2147 family)
MKNLLNSFAIAIMFFMAMQVQAQTVLGKWRTIDDETNEPKSIVELYEQNGKVYGKIIKLFRKSTEDQDPICDKCEDHRKNKKIIGMVFLTDMVKDGNEYTSGKILDAKKGKIYNCKLWLENGKLMVRGYVAFFFRTQTWVREN